MISSPHAEVRDAIVGLGVRGGAIEDEENRSAAEFTESWTNLKHRTSFEAQSRRNDVRSQPRASIMERTSVPSERYNLVRELRASSDAAVEFLNVD